jgi:hypothetical protein
MENIMRASSALWFALAASLAVVVLGHQPVTGRDDALTRLADAYGVTYQMAADNAVLGAAEAYRRAL